MKTKQTKPKPAALLALLLVFTGGVRAEVRYAGGIDAAGIERIKQSLALIEKKLPDNPLARWSRSVSDARYQGDIWIRAEELDDSTLGQWDGACIIVNAERLAEESLQELALIIYHEAIHADHHYRDTEAFLLNEYAVFFSPRQLLLFEMINEGLAVYAECALRYSFGANVQADHKYRNKPALERYNEDFYAYYKDLRRWMKGNAAYSKLEGSRFEEALFREYLAGFLYDPWYLDYYMPYQVQYYGILRGKDFALSPFFCDPAYAELVKQENIYRVLDRYIEKNSPAGFCFSTGAKELEDRFITILDRFESGNRNSKKDRSGEGVFGSGPAEAKKLRNLEYLEQSQRNYESLAARYREIPEGLEIRYKDGRSEKLAESLRLLLISLEVRAP